LTEIKILLTEDDLAHAKLVEVYLSATAQFEVSITHAITLEQCLKELKTNQFDVLLLDLGLPDSKGINTLERVIEKYQDQSIVLLTSDVDENLGVKAVKIGAQDFLHKEKLSIDSLSRAILYARERNVLLKQVNQTKQKYEIVFNGSSEAIYASKFDGSIEVCNKSFCDLLGYTMKEVLSEPGFTKKCYKNEEDREKLQGEIEKKGSVVNNEIKLINKQNKVIECSISANIWRNDNG